MTDRKPWDAWFLDLARFVAGRSRDPSTKVGAVIARPNRTIASFGFNGFPRGVADDPTRLLDRDFKIAATIHAEVNAILNAAETVKGYDLYVTPFHPCSGCAAVIAQSGIRRVIVDQQGEIPDRWRASCDVAGTVLREGGVHVETVQSVIRHTLPLVIIESPFAGDIEANIAYARAAVSDNIHRNEAPIASHLLHTQPGILRDEIPGERKLGMIAGHAWIDRADLVAVYTDRGISAGMEMGIAYAEGIGVPVVRRSIQEAARDAA